MPDDVTDADLGDYDLVRLEELAEVLPHPEISRGVPALVAALRRARADAKAGADFKAFVHSYLTEHGVPEGDPENRHQMEGCRIGARLDLLLGERDAYRKVYDLTMKGLESATEKIDPLKQEVRRLRALLGKAAVAMGPFCRGHEYADEELTHAPAALRDGLPLNAHDPDRSPKYGDCRRAAAVRAELEKLLGEKADA